MRRPFPPGRECREAEPKQKRGNRNAQFAAPLQDGHAPIYLHHAFHEAIDAYEDWPLDTAEPVVQINGKVTRIGVVFRRLWSCTDIVPRHTLEALKDIAPSALTHAERLRDNSTFAEAARIMRAALEWRKGRRIPVIA